MNGIHPAFCRLRLAVSFTAGVLACIPLSDATAAPAAEKTIVVIGAHADSGAAFADGTFARYIGKGYNGVYAVLATHRPGGDPAPGDLRPEPLEAIQFQSENALGIAGRYGAKAVFFNLHPTRIGIGRTLAFTGSPTWSRFAPPGTVEISSARTSRQAVAAIAQLLTEHNPEIVITHGIGAPEVDRHCSAEVVYYGWMEARRRGARLGQLWCEASERKGMIGEPGYRRFFEPLRISVPIDNRQPAAIPLSAGLQSVTEDFFVMADAAEPLPAMQNARFGPHWETALGDMYTYRGSKAQPVVMAVGSHADDVEAQMGGTLAWLQQQGWKGIYVVATNNTAGNSLSGNFPVGALETIQIRQEEARRAAAVFGLEPVFLNLHELVILIGRKHVSLEDPEWGLYNPPGNGPITCASEGKGLELMTRLLEEHQPDLVLTHLLCDKPEHGQTGDLVYHAFRRAQARGAKLGELWMPVGRFLDYFQRIRLQPDISLDVTESHPLNWAAALHHISQGTAGWSHLRPVTGKRKYEHFIVVAGEQPGI